MFIKCIMNQRVIPEVVQGGICHGNHDDCTLERNKHALWQEKNNVCLSHDKMGENDLKNYERY